MSLRPSVARRAAALRPFGPALLAVPAGWIEVVATWEVTPRAEREPPRAPLIAASLTAVANPRPKPHVLSLVADPRFQREPDALRHVGLREQLLVGVQAALVALELSVREARRVRAAEQLQQAGIPQLVE